MRNYYRVMLGKGSSHAEKCLAGNFIGGDFDIAEDLTNKLPDHWREFNKVFIPGWMKQHPGKSKIAAGLACGSLWVVSKGIQKGDIVLCPDGNGVYRVGEVTGDYTYVPGGILPHRRAVNWLPVTIQRTEMSEALRNSSGSIGTVSNISSYRDEIQKLMGNAAAPALVASDEAVEDPVSFALEMHLEDFLVQNWKHTDLGKEYDIYEDEGELVGKQYNTDTGRIDILAISKDKKRLLVLELKRGRASDVVVGQILRYMGYVKEELAEVDQTVHGVIIAHEDDQRIRRALSVIPNVVFYRYQVSFKLHKGG